MAEDKTYTTDYIKSDYEKMTFMGNPHVDALTSALQAVSGEVWTIRRRLYVTEALMEKSIPVTPAAIQKYVPSAEETALWKADRDRFVAGIYAPFLREGSLEFPSPKVSSYDPHKDTNRTAPEGLGDLKKPTAIQPSAANVPAPKK